MKILCNRILLVFVFFALTANFAAAQRRSAGASKSLEFHVSPSLGFKMMSAFKMPASYNGTEQMFRDSLAKADRPGQNLNFGLMYTRKKNVLEAISYGLSYTTLSFRRRITDVKLGTEIHPKVGYVAGLVGAGFLEIQQDFRFQYLEASIFWHRSAEGLGRNLKEFNLWYIFGFSPAVLVRDRVLVRTVGFTNQEGKDRFVVKDDNITGMRANLFLQGAYRVEYNMFPKTNAVIQPRLRVPLLPASRGDQTIFIPQFSLDIGLIFKLGDE